MTRRTMLARTGLSAGALAFGGIAGTAALARGRVAFHGAHQAGITTPPQAHILFQAFDATARSRGGLDRLLEARGYNFSDGLLPDRRLDAGLFFAAFQRDPRRQFIPIQHRLAATTG